MLWTTQKYLVFGFESREQEQTGASRYKALPDATDRGDNISLLEDSVLNTARITQTSLSTRMQQLSYRLTHEAVNQPAIGLVVLQSDETLEHELKRWLPEHYRLFHTRIPNSLQVDSVSLTAMRDLLPQSVALLPSNANFKVIAYGCTSASTLIGEQGVRDAIHSVRPGCAVTNPISAIKAKLASVSAKRIALLTPYEPTVSQALVQHLERHDYHIVHAATFNESRDDKVARISIESLNNAIDTLASKRDIDAVVASCTNLRTFDLLSAAIEKVGCPVISSNSALAWHIQVLAETP